MPDDRLARVHWRMGQTLLPQHFISQEQALLADVAGRLELLPMPFFGIGELSWNEPLLIEGVVSITSMKVLLPSGQYISIPENAAVKPFNLNITGQARVSVFFHLLGEAARSSGLLSGGSSAAVQRVVYDAAINGEESVQAAVQTFGLADFAKDAEGNWALVPDYVPPLLKVGTSPFLRRLIDEIDDQVENFHFKMVRQITATYLSGESLHSSKKILQAVYKLQGFLQNLKAQVNFHPFHVFEALKEFYIELCFYQNTTPEHVKSAYLHEDIASCLGEIASPLLLMLTQVKAEQPYVAFERKDGMFKIDRLPDKLASATQTYLLVQKERVGDRFKIERLKLASSSRVSIVHQLSLGGVPMEKIDRPPFQHSFGPEVEFYRVVGGEEWDHALRDMSVAFYEQPEFKDIKAYVYWREG